jgi:hypothetical protein
LVPVWLIENEPPASLIDAGTCGAAGTVVVVPSGCTKVTTTVVWYSAGPVYRSADTLKLTVYPLMLAEDAAAEYRPLLIEHSTGVSTKPLKATGSVAATVTEPGPPSPT